MPPEIIHARQTLQQKAREILQSTFDKGIGPRRRALWWDAGGHLKGTLRSECNAMNAKFVAHKHPLAFRAWVAEQGSTPDQEPERVVWYVPEAKAGRDWFRDVQVMGDEIEKGIEDLAAELYGIHPWQLRPWESDEALSAEVATILKDRLSVKTRPSLQELQSKLLTNDESQPVEYILREGWERLEQSDAVVKKIRELLTDEHVPDLRAEDGPDAIVSKVRRWAVAGWLQKAGALKDAFPSVIAQSNLAYAHRRLKAVLRSGDSDALLKIYQQDYWPDVVGALSDLWEFGKCPVDGSLDTRLWETWLEQFAAEDYETCHQWARQRSEALREATGWNTKELTKDAPARIRAWNQAAALAELGHRYATWKDRDVSWHALYADREEGSWHIDRAVRRIIVSGKPERELPADHPARNALDEHRRRLVRDQYLDYLRELGEITARVLTSKKVLTDGLQPSVKFWSEHDEELATGTEIVLFYLDALRLDLARDLAGQLDDRGFTVQETTWMGVLPSRTEFGMGALLPGRWKAFDLRMRKGKLRAFRNGGCMDTTRRYQRLEEEGWSVTSDARSQSDWAHNRVAYVDTELDDIGENEFDQIERKLAQRVDELAGLITRVLKQGGWSRAYVVTDHGFVLLPEGTQFETISPPDDTWVKRRYVAAAHLPKDGSGVLLSRETAPEAFPYLTTPVCVLVNPQSGFSKKGLPKSCRYYHGGALPQECILSFLTIEQS